MKPLVGLSRRGLLGAVAGVAVLAAAGCAGEDRDPLALYVVGDSLTVGDSADVAGLDFGPAAWPAHLDERLSVIGCWAEPPATTGDMMAGVTESEAGTLVLLAGANDVGRLPFETSLYHLEQIVATVGAPRVVLSALPPSDTHPQAHVKFNQNLSLLARDLRWSFVDPMAGIRDGVRWREGMTADGRHPSLAGAREIGRALSRFLLEPQ
ncbi:MAG: SGNH/GDSL hydrolase family protein [Propionibacteriaceae bacterium]|nr:SGNH/GDSL hydrolase family protein [Propionibacteriaceae bacterium]